MNRQSGMGGTRKLVLRVRDTLSFRNRNYHSPCGLRTGVPALTWLLLWPGMTRHIGAGALRAWRDGDFGLTGLSCQRESAPARPVKLGWLSRWRRSDIEEWIADGCPKVA